MFIFLSFYSSIYLSLYTVKTDFREKSCFMMKFGNIALYIYIKNRVNFLSYGSLTLWVIRNAISVVLNLYAHRINVDQNHHIVKRTLDYHLVTFQQCLDDLGFIECQQHRQKDIRCTYCLFPLQSHYRMKNESYYEKLGACKV